MRDARLCSSCSRSLPTNEFVWVSDRYGIPWRKVCIDCEYRVRDEIAGFRFDPDDAGERLEPDAE